MISKNRHMWLTLSICFMLSLTFVGQTTAQEYKIGPEDILEIIFWEQPALNAEVRVGLDGNVTIDRIGRAQAAGQTTTELQDEIIRRISRLNTGASEVVVRVISFNYNKVYLTGEVEQPGKLTYESIPGLWNLIMDAGGLTDIADLTQVTIIRGGDKTGQVETVNVAQALSDGTLDQLPKIRRLDTVELPRNVQGVQSSTLAQDGDKSNVIYVVGAVSRPGPITFEENTDIMEAIAMAGGPLPTADLKQTRLITGDGRYAQTMQVNLEKFTETGRPARYRLRKEDTIFLPSQSGGSFLSNNMGNIVALLGAVTSAILIYQQLKPDDEVGLPVIVAP